MVAMVVNNKGMLHFRAMWKFPGKAVDRGEFYSGSLFGLAGMLFRLEGISRESIEYVYVHQLLGEGSVLEIISIDSKSSPNINPHLIWSKNIHEKEAPSIPSWEDWEREDSWDIGLRKDDLIMEEVTELLQRKGGSEVVADLIYSAVPAVSKVRKEN